MLSLRLCNPGTNNVKIASMPHVVLLGDSIFDNTHYTGAAPMLPRKFANCCRPDGEYRYLLLTGPRLRTSTTKCSAYQQRQPTLYYLSEETTR